VDRIPTTGTPQQDGSRRQAGAAPPYRFNAERPVSCEDDSKEPSLLEPDLLRPDKGQGIALIWRMVEGARFQVMANGERVVFDRGPFRFAAP